MGLDTGSSVHIESGLKFANHTVTNLDETCAAKSEKKIQFCAKTTHACYALGYLAKKVLKLGPSCIFHAVLPVSLYHSHL